MSQQETWTASQFKAMVDKGMIKTDGKRLVTTQALVPGFKDVIDANMKAILRPVAKPEKNKKVAKVNSPKNEMLKLDMVDYLETKYPVEEEVMMNTLFETDRMYRCDYVVNGNIIIEVNGGQHKGRHTSGAKVKGKEYTCYENDLNKLNLLSQHGFTVYQFTYPMLERKEYKIFL